VVKTPKNTSKECGAEVAISTIKKKKKKKKSIAPPAQMKEMEQPSVNTKNQVSTERLPNNCKEEPVHEAKTIGIGQDVTNNIVNSTPSPTTITNDPPLINTTEALTSKGKRKKKKKIENSFPFVQCQTSADEPLVKVAWCLLF
jgi:hypothetical protein